MEWVTAFQLVEFEYVGQGVTKILKWRNWVAEGEGRTHE